MIINLRAFNVPYSVVMENKEKLISSTSLAPTTTEPQTSTNSQPSDVSPPYLIHHVCILSSICLKTVVLMILIWFISTKRV